MTTRTEHRCTPGAPQVDRRCTRHSKHYWCPWCAGYYGVDHMASGASGKTYGFVCHSAPRRLQCPGNSRPDPQNCVCWYCTLIAAHGRVAADAVLAFRHDLGPATAPTGRRSGEPRPERVTAAVRPTKKMTRAERVLHALVQAAQHGTGPLRYANGEITTLVEDGWIDGWVLCHPSIGGTEGLRRLRELRAAGHDIERRRHPNGDRDTNQYRLAPPDGVTEPPLPLP